MEQFTRRGFFVATVAAASGCIGGNGEDTSESDTGMEISSLAFEDGGEIPTEYTCDGANSSPPLRISGVPEETAALALVVDDPDVPTPDRRFVHWLLWNLPADTEQVPQSVPRGPSVSELGGAVQGTNDADEVGYSGPCPPGADGPHTYRFFLYALEEEIELEAGATRDQLDAAIEGKVVAETRLEGTYDS
jgi:Raf kinase inhibitor-like YbhB/YbcL family protein